MLLKKELSQYNRYQAFAIHMAISLVIFFILLVCITQYWYPGILFDTGNGWRAIGMIVSIDLILGPLLTLIVFNPIKNSLKFDLAIIALVQSAALLYGSWTIYQTRPAAIVLMSDKFVTYYYSSIVGEKIYELSVENDFMLSYEVAQENASFEINPEQFKPYKEQILPALPNLRIFSLINEKTQSMLIPLDPHQDKNRFVEIDIKQGNFISIVNLTETQTANN